jgi:2'-5' RNA ligase
MENMTTPKRYCVSLQLATAEAELISDWCTDMFGDDIQNESAWKADSPHITILYIGEMSLSPEKERELQELVTDITELRAPLYIMGLRAGSWGSVLMLDISDPSDSIQKQYRQLYDWCLLNGKIPEMTNGDAGKHPGAHITICFPESKAVAEALAIRERPNLYTLLHKLPNQEELTPGKPMLDAKPVRVSNSSTTTPASLAWIGNWDFNYKYDGGVEDPIRLGKFTMNWGNLPQDCTEAASLMKTEDISQPLFLESQLQLGPESMENMLEEIEFPMTKGPSIVDDVVTPDERPWRR